MTDSMLTRRQNDQDDPWARFSPAPVAEPRQEQRADPWAGFKPAPVQRDEPDPVQAPPPRPQEPVQPQEQRQGTRLQDVVPEPVRQADEAAGAWFAEDARKQLTTRLERLGHLQDIADGKHPETNLAESAIVSARENAIREIESIATDAFKGEQTETVKLIVDYVRAGGDPRRAAQLVDDSVLNPESPLRTPLGWAEALGRAIPAGTLGAVGSAVEGTGLIGQRLGIGGEGLQRTGRAISEFGQEIGPDDDYKGVATDIFSGVGSMGVYYGAGVPAALLTRTWGTVPRFVATTGTAAALAGPSGATEAYQRATEFGLSDEEALEVAMYGIPAGVIQIAPVGYVLRALPAEMRGSVTGQIRHVIEAAIGEFGAEGAGVVAQNFIEQSYNPEQGIWDDALYSALIGGAAGGITTAGLQMLTGGEGVAPTEPQVDPETGLPMGAQPAEQVLGEDPEQVERQRQIEEARQRFRDDMLGRPGVPQQEATPAPEQTPEPPAATPAPTQSTPSRLDDWLSDPRSAQEIVEGAQEQVREQDRMAEDMQRAVAEVEAERARRGTQSTPIEVDGPAAVNENAQITAQPTPAQAEAGNYRKRHLRWQGFDISVETEAGQERTGTDSDGNPWSVVMPAPYGDIKRTRGADGDPLDVYIGPSNTANVFVVDQIDPATGRFDEHKAMLGFDDADQAGAVYDQAFSDGSGTQRMGAMTPMTVAQFRQWVKNGDTRKPVAYREPPKGQRAPRQPRSLLEFLASRGGLRPNPEIDYLDISNQSVRGFGRLIRDDGMELDQAREAAAEAGFFGGDPGSDVARSTIPQLLDMMDAEARGGRTTTMRPEDRAVADQRAQRRRENDPAYQQAQAERMLADGMEQIGLPEGWLDPDVEQRAVDLIIEGVAPINAIEQAQIEILADDPEAGPEIAQALAEDGFDESEIPFDSSDDVAQDGEQGPAAETQETAAPVGTDDAGAGGTPGEAGAAVEPGAEGLPQQLVPGVAPVTDRDRLDVEADRPMAPSRPQAEPGGLFGPERDQTDMFDAPAAAPVRISTPETEARTDWYNASEAEKEAAIRTAGLSLPTTIRWESLSRDTQAALTDALKNPRAEPTGATEPETAADLSTETAGTETQEARRDPNQPIGVNRFGQRLYEDERGVRSFGDIGGIRVTESVGFVPGGGISLNPDARDSRFLTAAEDDARAADRPGVPFSEARPGDQLRGAGNSYLVRKRVAPKSDATAFAEAVGGYTSLDGMRHWAVIKEGAITADEAETAWQEFKASQEESTRETSRGDFGTPETPNVRALAGAFSDHFNGGGRFASIAQARKFAAERLGGAVKPGTEAAKAVDEAIEFGVVMTAREMVSDARAGAREDAAIFDDLVGLYQRQPKLSVRSSTSVADQAYSTPMPLAFVASRLAGISDDTTVYEPSAGNGALLIEAAPDNVVANEFNADRAENLQAQGYETAIDDATTFDPGRKFDVIIQNPPFGAVRDARGRTRNFTADGLKTREIDHAIVMQSLTHMADNGSAVLLVGGINKQARSEEARSDAYNGKSKREFYFALYNRYNVVDHFTVAGELYERQGAGWPVDVIVIRGKGKSGRALPAADVPIILDSWDAVKGKLDVQYPAAASATDDQALGPARPDDTGGTRRDDERGDTGVRDSQPSAAGGRVADPDRRSPVVRDGPDRGQRDASGTAEPASEIVPARDGGTRGAATRADAGVTQETQPPIFQTEAQAETQGALEGETQTKPKPRKRPESERERIDTSEAQVAYRAKSKARSMSTLVPTNVQTAVSDALNELSERVGDIDTYVARELGMTQKQLADSFGAEQVDGIALAIDNFSRGAGFIVGDQTGIGKGRQVAAVLRWSIKNGKTPIFVTEKPNLYADMYRDLMDVGIEDMLGREIKILMTNSGESVPLTDDGKKVLKSQGAGPHGQLLRRLTTERSASPYDIVFTTYAQMQTVKKNETDRMRFLREIARNRGVIVMDESHNAGGQKQTGRDGERDDAPDMNRAVFARELTTLADAVLYSSATYAKRPDVMDLYAKTDMRLAVDDPADIGELIAKGGVPMQQIVASMLSRAGQYLRRERSFDGIRYETPLVPVDRQAYENFSSSIAAIQAFSEGYMKQSVKNMDKRLKAEAKKVLADGSTGGAGASSTNFTSVMHNVINQMLVSLTADQAADQAINSLRNGEKPVITVASTLESFLDQYAEDKGISVGEAIPITAGDLLMRYLERSREVTVKAPGAQKGEGERIYLTDADLGASGLAAFNAAKKAIKKSGLESLPVSPIDWMRKRIVDAGFSVGEITGREKIIDYRSDGEQILSQRPGAERSIRGRREAISNYNSGKLDVLILNQAGSTGLSLHASERVQDKRPRHMIIAQAEGNIDTHMQMLGRVNRTGQVVLPRYSQLVADVPATKRPAAVLAKKMASLNANTTGARSSAVTAKDTPDFMNAYGDKVAAAVMQDNPDIHTALGDPLNESDDGLVADEAMRKVTGRIPLLPLAQQEDLYAMLESEYSALIEQMEATGQNALEAKTLDLDATLVETTEVRPPKDQASPFADGVYFEKLDVKRIGKPMSSDEVAQRVRESVGVDADASMPEARRAAREQNRAMLNEQESNFATFTEEQVKAIEGPEKAQNLRTKLRAVQSRWSDIAKNVEIGQGMKLKTIEGNYYGVVTKVERTGKTKNPLALGSWKVTFALADASRQITLPFSQLYTARVKPTNIPDSWIEIERTDKVGSMPIIDAFDDMQTERRETRIMVTGNILAGYDAVNGKGAIVNFTDNEGRLRQGIMMRRDFDAEKFLETKPVRFVSSDQVMRFIERTQAPLESTDGLVDVRMSPDGDIRIMTDAGRGRGGKYFLNKSVLDAAGKDFVKASGKMRVDVPPTRASRVLDAMRDVGAVFETKANLDVARKIVDGSDDFRAARRRGDDAPQVTSVGSTTVEFTLRPEFVESLDQFEGDLRQRLDDLGLTDVGVRLVDKIRFMVNGEAFAADGAYMKGLISVALDGWTDARQVLDHEAIHALKRLGFFTEQEWTLLERRAQGWLDRYNIEREYADVPPGVRLEEAIAHAFADWRAGRLNQSGLMARIFRRIRDFVERLGNSLNGLGFNTAEDVFRSVSSGAVGRRGRQRRGGRDQITPVAARRTMQNQATMQGFIARGQPLDRAMRIPFSIFGGLDRTGAWRPGQMLFDKARQTITQAKMDPQGRFGFLSGPIEAARAGLIDRYGLDDAYVSRERRRGLDERRIMSEGVEILNTLKDANVGTQEAKVLQAILTGEPVSDADMQKLAQPIREAVDQLGEEAVSLGLISAESFERNRGSYLHRIYLKDEENQNALARFVTKAMSSRRKKIIGDTMKGRGIFFDIDAGRLTRDDPEWEMAKRGKPEKGEKFRLMEYVPGRFTDTVSGQEREQRATRRVWWPADRDLPKRLQGEGWTDRGTWELRGERGGKLTLWRDYTKEERRRMGEILDARYTIGRTYMLMAHDLAVGRFYKDISENEEWTSTQEPSAPWKDAGQFNRYWNDPEIQWVKVPDDVIAKTGGKKRWGALAGKWVRAEIWRDLNEIEIMSRPSTWRRLLTQWKLNKALALDTPIPTASGWTTMGEIKVGDSLFDENGQPCTVLEVKDVAHGRPCYEVTFSDGSTIVADQDHWWFTKHRNKGGGVRTTKEIIETLTINHRGEAAHSVPVAKALAIDAAADLPVPPYALGLWLGDGHSGSPRITIGSRVLDEITASLLQEGVHRGPARADPRSSAVTFTIDLQPVAKGSAPNLMKQACKALGIMGDKSIPPSYLRAGMAQRWALLRGLMDADGWITTRGTCGFATSLPVMRDGVLELLRTLGYKPTCGEIASASGKPAWRIHFQAYAGDPVFSLTEKASRLRPRPERPTRSTNRQIVAITPVASVPVRCISVSSESQLYLAGEAMVPTHNTARSPVVHMNNVMSNLLFMDMANVRFQDLAAGLTSFIKRDRDYQEALENGAFGADMMSQEIRDNVLRPILDELRRDVVNNTPNSFLNQSRFLGRMADRIWTWAKTADQKMVDAYRIEDEIFRMATYMRRRQFGDSAEQAANFAREQFLDYDIRAPWVNAARNSVLPFISYTYRAVPLIARSMAYHPWKMPKYFLIAYTLNALAYMWDEGDDGEERERASMRGNEQGYTWVGVPRMLRMPYRDENGLPVFLDIRRWIPAGDIFDMNQGQSSLPVPAPLQFGGPLMLGAELMLNRQAFTGRDIVNQKTDNWMDVSQKVGDWAWKSWMPSAAWVPGSWYWQKISNAASGATDAQGRPYGVPEALASSIGIKLRPQDVEEGLFWRFRDFQQVENELRAQTRSLGRQRERGLISEAAFEREMTSILTKMERNAEKAEDLARRATPAGQSQDRE